MFQLMMVIAGENMDKRRFMDPKILGNFKLFFLRTSKIQFFIQGNIAKFYVSVSVITEHITDARIDSHKTV